MQRVVCAASIRISKLSIGRHPSWGTRPQLGQVGPSVAPQSWHIGMMKHRKIVFSFGEEHFALKADDWVASACDNSWWQISRSANSLYCKLIPLLIDDMHSYLQAIVSATL